MKSKGATSSVNLVDSKKKNSNHKQEATNTFHKDAVKVLACFFISIILIIPLWWKCTDTYRAKLPSEEEITERYFHQQKHQQHQHHQQHQQYQQHHINSPFPISLSLHLPCDYNDINIGDNEHLYNSFQNEVYQSLTSTSNENSAKFSVVYNVSVGCTAIETVVYDPDLSFSQNDIKLKESYEEQVDKYHLFVITEQHPKAYVDDSWNNKKGNTDNDSNKKNHYGQCALHISPFRHYIAFCPFFESGNKVQEKLLLDAIHTLWRADGKFLNFRQLDQHENMLRIPLSSNVQLTFSLLFGESASDNGTVTWDIRRAVSDYLSPFLSQLSHLYDFSVDSQIKRYVELEIEPAEWSENGTRVFYFNSNVLPHILTHPNKWNFDATSTTETALHFLVYVPSETYSPLFILNGDLQKWSKTNAYILPRTGGVMILNSRSVIKGEAIKQKLMRQIFSIFITQLRKLLGLQYYSTYSRDSSILSINPSEFAIADWELDALTRRTIFEKTHASLSSIRSLVNLTNSISNMVVNENIKENILNSMAAITESRKEGNGRKASWALEYAEEAFFDSSMLGMLYFPSNHQFAIYAPLLLPVIMPLAGRVYMLLKQRKKK